jgi:hypothetical protein
MGLITVGCSVVVVTPVVGREGRNREEKGATYKEGKIPRFAMSWGGAVLQDD